MMNEVRVEIIKNVIPILEKSISKFSEKIEEPIWDGNSKEGFYPRYKNPNSGHFQLLMAVKVVSTLNAAVCLLKDGYIQEVGVLIRIVDECNAKILCIEEAHVNRTLNSEQMKIINEYFKYDVRKSTDLFVKEKWWADMDKIFASQSRLLSQGTANKDIHNIQKNIRAIYDAFTGYVHGFYSHIMELYDAAQGKFMLRGFKDGHTYKPTIDTVSSVVLRSLNVFSMIALRFDLVEVKEELVKARDLFMKSEAYSVK